jgi:uncharacterized membrane protein
MKASEADVRQWVEAGILDAATADRILEFESARSTQPRGPSARPEVPELLVYLASAIVAVGATVLVATNWEHFASAARIAIPGAAGIAVLAAGYLLRATRHDALTRGASLAWLLAGVLISGTAAIAASEWGWSEENVALAGAVVAALSAVVLWTLLPMHPQVLGIGAAAFFLSTAVSALAHEDWIVAVLGVLLASFGLAALVLTETGVLVPRPTARLVAGAGLAFGAFWAGMPPSPPFTELLSLVVFPVLVAAGIRYQSLLYVAFAVLTAFQALLKLVLRHIEDPTAAGLALMAVGLLLLLAIAGLRSTPLWKGWNADARADEPERSTMLGEPENVTDIYS